MVAQLMPRVRLDRSRRRSDERSQTINRGTLNRLAGWMRARDKEREELEFVGPQRRGRRLS
jgi:hypothetical protein